MVPFDQTMVAMVVLMMAPDSAVIGGTRGRRVVETSQL